MFALRWIVIGVAFEATRFRRFGARMMASAARRNAGQQNVRALLARRRRGVATFAANEAMLRVIKLRARHVARGDIRRRDFGQRGAIVQEKRVALLARLAPQKLFVLGGAFRYPLRRREQTIVRGNRFLRQVAARISRHAQILRMRRNVGLQFRDDVGVNHFRLVVRRRVREAPVEL